MPSCIAEVDVEGFKFARAVDRFQRLAHKRAQYMQVKRLKFAQKKTRCSEAVTSGAREQSKPHRAARTAARSSLSMGSIEAEADMPTLSQGRYGFMKPCVSPALRFRPSQKGEGLWEGDFEGGCWIQDADTTAADISDSGDDNSDSQVEVMAPETAKPSNETMVVKVSSAVAQTNTVVAQNEVATVDFDMQVQLTRSQAEEAAHNLREQVEEEVKAMKAAAKAEACAEAKSIVATAQMQAERDARAIKKQALDDACNLKARVESQLQAKAEAAKAEAAEAEAAKAEAAKAEAAKADAAKAAGAKAERAKAERAKAETTLPVEPVGVETKKIEKVVLGLKYAKQLDQQRSRKHREQTEQDRRFQQELEQTKSNVAAECRAVMEKALTEAAATKARATVEARAIRAKALESAKLKARREEPKRVVEACVGFTETDVVTQAQDMCKHSETPTHLEAACLEPVPQPVITIPVALVVAQDFPDVDAGWEVLPDSTLESIPGWDVVV